MASLGVKKFVKNAKLPVRGSNGAVGYDLHAIVSGIIEPGKKDMVPTGIGISLPPGTYGRIAPRSGLAAKHGINVGAGVIDPDYTGELKVILFNHGDKTFEYQEGDRIAQLILEKCVVCPVVEVDVLEETTRSEGGFGSTGK